MSIAHYVVSFVFCVHMFSCSCSTLLSHFVYWIVLSAGLASLTLQQPQLLSCTMYNVITICTVVVVDE